MTTPARRTWASTLADWTGVIVVLAVIDAFIALVFVPARVVPEFDVPGKMLRDMTAGQNWALLFAVAKRRAHTSEPFIVMVGDSTVLGVGDWEVPDGKEEDEETLTGLVRAAIERATNAHLEAMEFAALGLSASEAAVVGAKAIAMRPALMLYAVTPRVICALEHPATDAARYALDSDVASRLGLPFVLGGFPVDQLAMSAVRSHWQLLTFRRELDVTIAHRIGRLSSTIGAALTPPPYAAVEMMEAGANDRPLGTLWTWTNCRLDDGNPRIRALRALFRMCARSGRCLLYHGPVNPDGLANFAPGLLTAFRALVAQLAADSGVPFEDYHDLLPASDFRVPYLTRVDPIHMNLAGRTHLANRLGRAAARALTTQRAS